MLHVTRWGAGSAVVAVHGFTQSGQAWGPFGALLGAAHRVVAVDAPGHGGSADVDADLWAGAELIATAGGAAPAAYLGYSMGGRFALHVALRRPARVRRLVLISATGGLDTEGERAARRAADDALAAQVERDGVAAFVAWWLERPLFATLSPAAAGVDARLGGTAAGLASSLRRAGTGTQEPLWDRLGELEMPVLVIAGALDEPYAARAERLTAAIGANATLAIVAGAGHACHLEQPDAVWAAVEPFLAEP
jgi:2-succinyl-6-hydroxy-2,4-cyclohexadiene-1-carboxylate synthase